MLAKSRGGVFFWGGGGWGVFGGGGLGGGGFGGGGGGGVFGEENQSKEIFEEVNYRREG